ncbi:MAG: transcription termination/antitermination NusG family protein, partial [Mycobacteriales bacterium]
MTETYDDTSADEAVAGGETALETADEAGGEAAGEAVDGAGGEAVDEAAGEAVDSDPLPVESGTDAAPSYLEPETVETTTPEEPQDPSDELRERLRTLPGDWYVVHSYAGYENKVKTNLESRISSLNMEDYIFQIEVPTEEVTEVKGGKRQQVTRKKLPGYLFVRMDLTDESWSAVRNTPGVTG